MLTPDQREYILKGRDAETNAEKRKTYDYRIRTKAREAIIDLKFLFEHLPPDQQKQIFLTDDANELVSEIVKKYPPTHIKIFGEEFEQVEQMYKQVTEMYKTFKPLGEAQKIKEEYEKKLQQLQQQEFITESDVKNFISQTLEEMTKKQTGEIKETLKSMGLTDQQIESFFKKYPTIS